MISSNPDLLAAATIQTFVGEMVDIFNPDPTKLHIKDISHALSMLCRYGGHSNRFYSVAEHSTLMAQWFVERNEYDGANDMARAALLHDATEAYMGDLVRPIKLKMPLYRQTEDILQRMIFRVNGISEEMPPEVKDADLRICNDERAVLLDDLPWSPEIDSLPPLGVEVQGWSPVEAEQHWLSWYWRLF